MATVYTTWQCPFFWMTPTGSGRPSLVWLRNQQDKFKVENPKKECFTFDLKTQKLLNLSPALQCDTDSDYRNRPPFKVQTCRQTYSRRPCPQVHNSSLCGAGLQGAEIKSYPGASVSDTFLFYPPLPPFVHTSAPSLNPPPLFSNPPLHKFHAFVFWAEGAKVTVACHRNSVAMESGFKRKEKEEEKNKVRKLRHCPGRIVQGPLCATIEERTQVYAISWTTV